MKLRLLREGVVLGAPCVEETLHVGGVLKELISFNITCTNVVENLLRQLIHI